MAKKKKMPARKRKQVRTGGMRRHIGKADEKDMPPGEDAGC